ncbi:MAG TPA: hypothetical protein VN610_04445, partial [Bryobacteraceae bacterium]|nr:hypothetical protein [Bryobacteraceae bacterium]
MFEAVFTKNLVQPPVKRFGDNWSPQYLSYADSAELKDSVDPDPVMANAYGGCTIGPSHLFNCGVVEPNDPVVSWMPNYLEDCSFLFP